MNESPLQRPTVQFTFVAIKIAHLLYLGREHQDHVADVLVELGITPLLILELLHTLQHTNLDNFLGKLFVREEVPEHCEGQTHNLLNAAAC